MIFRLVELIGTARPSPMPATAVLIPTTRAPESARAPPELPGFSDASVWMTSSTRRTADPPWFGSDRPTALTTPPVTDPATPIGLPPAPTTYPPTTPSTPPTPTHPFLPPPAPTS